MSNPICPDPRFPYKDKTTLCLFRQNVEETLVFFKNILKNRHLGKTIRGRRWPVCLYSLPSGSPRFCCAAGAAGFLSVAAVTGVFFTGFLTFFTMDVLDTAGFFIGFTVFFMAEAFDTADFFADFAVFFIVFTGLTAFFTTGFLTVFLARDFTAVFFVVFDVFLEDAVFAFFELTGFFVFFTVLPFEILFFTIITLIDKY